MEMIIEGVATGQTFLRERLDSVYRSLQYKPWFIKLSTLDRRLLLFILLAPILVLIIIIILAASTSKSGKTPLPSSRCLKLPQLQEHPRSYLAPGACCTEAS